MFWKYAWRGALLIGVIAACFCAIFVWSIWRSTNPVPLTAGKPVESLDVISLQIDILSLTMAAVGIGLGAIGLFGYQALKEAAEARAELAAIDVASKKADEVATAAVAKHMENAGIAPGLSNRGQLGNRQATIDPNDVIPAGQEEAGNGRNH